MVIGATLAVAVLSCLSSICMSTALPEAPAVPTRASAPGKVAEPTSFPTPAYLTVARIEQERKDLTDIQKEQYDQNVLGEVIQFKGRVLDVHEDGDVLLDEGGLFTLVRLLGIPKDAAITLQKDQLIEGMGTVAEVGSFLGLTIEIQVTSWNN